MDQALRSHWQGKSAVVTGGARGQGASVALHLLQAGAFVHVVDTLDGADPAWRRLHQAGILRAWHGDVSDPATWDAIATAIAGRGETLLGLVNNAGITGPRDTVTRTQPAQWERVMAVNVTGAMLGIRALAPAMTRGAAIVNISSTVGMTGYHSAAYSTSKWALRGLTRSAALELAPQGIRVNCVCPGVVDTEMVRNSPVLLAALKGVIPLRQMAAAEQIAEVVLFLLGPQASYITAADIAVDGGITGAGLYGQVAQAVGAIETPIPHDVVTCI